MQNQFASQAAIHSFIVQFFCQCFLVPANFIRYCRACANYGIRSKLCSTTTKQRLLVFSKSGSQPRPPYWQTKHTWRNALQRMSRKKITKLVNFDCAATVYSFLLKLLPSLEIFRSPQGECSNRRRRYLQCRRTALSTTTKTVLRCYFSGRFLYKESWNERRTIETG